MYAEQTNTGYNLMEMNLGEINKVRDSLRLATLHCELSPPERAVIEAMIAKIIRTVERLAPGDYDSRL